MRLNTFILLSVMLSVSGVLGCASDEGDGNGGDGRPSPMVRIVAEQPGENCEFGGVSVQRYLPAVETTDEVDNEVGDEILEATFLCNGQPGQPGGPGEPGDPGVPGAGGTPGVPGEPRDTGADGAVVLFVIEDLAADPDGPCPAGGHAVHAGLDLDGDGELGQMEITSTAYICDGIPGTDGTPCTVVQNEDGVAVITCGDISVEIRDGEQGEAGVSSLVRLDEEPRGENCPTGGVAIRSGLDLDGDGSLSSDEVVDERFICNAPFCGDGVLSPEAGEVCDDGVNDGSYLGCMPGCMMIAPHCGDGILQEDYEECDDLDLGGLECTDFGYYAGDLACASGCEFDTSDCLGGLLWVETIGPGYNWTDGLSVNAQGDVAVVGQYRGTVSLGGEEYESYPASSDVYVAVYHSSGQLKWGRAYSGERNNYAWAVAIDDQGSVYVGGRAHSTTDFGGGPLLDLPYAETLFLLKLDSSGQHVWSRGLGISSGSITEMLVDQDGNILFTASMSGTVDLGGGVTVNHSSTNGLLVKMAPDGSALWYQSLNTGSGGSSLSSIASDGDGNVMIAGVGWGDLDFGDGLVSIPQSSRHYFVAKYDSEGELIWYQLYAHHNGWVEFESLAADSSGSVLVAGYFDGELMVDGEVFETEWVNLFVIKLDSHGNLLWFFYPEIEEYSYAYAVTTDSDDNVIVTGQYIGDLVLGDDTLNASNYNIFVAKLDSSGDPIWSESYGGGGDDGGWKIGAGADDTIYVTGWIQDGVDFGSGPVEVFHGYDAVTMAIRP